MVISAETWLRKTRYRVLLLASLLVIILPAFHKYVPFPEILFLSSMSFLFVQSMVVARFDHSLSKFFRYAIALLLLAIIWVQPAGVKSGGLEMLKLTSQAVFFGFVIFSLFKYITRASAITTNVIVVVVIVYLLMGIIAGNISALLFLALHESFAFPEWIDSPGYVDFLYFGFVAMTTTGFGDITPVSSEAKTFTYLLAITGQLYVAIVIAVIVGKYLSGRGSSESNKHSKLKF
jgi:voltage-gated potassium channel